MSRTRRLSRWLLVAIAVTALWTASAAHALNQARLFGTITDENKKPLAGVQLTVTCPEIATFKIEVTTDAKGNWAVTLIDATKSYNYKYEKTGYQTMQTDLKIPIGSNERRDFQMLSDAEAIKRGSAVEAPREPTPQEKAVVAFNQGAEASQMGDMATAKTKMIEASTLDPLLGVAHSALAGMLYADKDYTAAAAAAERALAIDPKDARSLRVAVEANTALGNTAKAKEASAALAAVDPKAAALDLFNQGVREYNGGSMPAALKLFEQSLAADSTYGKTHYMLGMCFISQGENAKAKEHLEAYIAVAAADDADAKTAKEMLSYLK
ncbi:MAG: carboxypeptidase-like regulatory domain-containing protein [Thermoanaerobaculia bacterium]